MADTVGAQLGDRLQNALRPEGFTRMHCFAEHAFLDQGVGLGVLDGRKAVFCTGNVEADDLHRRFGP